MRQQGECVASATVSIAAAEQEAAVQRLNEQVSYTDCLEDVQLFAQLGALDAYADNDELLQACDAPNDFDLVELVNEALQEAPKTKETATAAAAAVTKVKRTRGPRRAQPRAPLVCDVCGRSFSEPYNLRIHKMTHTDEKPHICDTCGKGFRQLNKLRIHYVTHTNTRPHECDICGKGFRYANYLAVHRRLHTGEKPYACSVCSTTFHSIHARRVHMKLQHAADAEADAAPAAGATSALSYTCPVCSRVLTDQCYLNTHLKRHYNQRDYPCSHCEKRFFSSSELKHHQIAHSLLRPYSCNVCEARFLRKSNWKQHLKIHAR